MGMSTYVVGYKPADEKWNKMKAIWDSCIEMGITPPTEVIDFFDDTYPGDAPGAEVKLSAPAVEKWGDGFRAGFEVRLDKLPKDIKFLRFVNFW